MGDINGSTYNIFVPSGGNFTLDASGDYCAAIFRASPGKTITKIGAYINSSTAGVVDVKLETVSSNASSGTLAATGTELLTQSVSALTWYNWTLGTSYAVPSNSVTLLAATLRWNSGTCAIRLRASGGATTDLPRTVEYNAGGSAQQRPNNPCICVEYSDGTVNWQSYGATALNTGTYNTGSANIEYGNKFSVSANMLAIGIYAGTRYQTSASSAIFRIYDADRNTLTTDAECTLNGESGVPGGVTMQYLYFTTPVPLIAGRDYYITRLANSPSADHIYYSTTTWASSAHRNAIYNGMTHVYRASTGVAFTEDTTKTDVLCPIISGSFSSKISVG